MWPHQSRQRAPDARECFYDIFILRTSFGSWGTECPWLQAPGSSEGPGSLSTLCQDSNNFKAPPWGKEHLASIWTSQVSGFYSSLLCVPGSQISVPLSCSCYFSTFSGPVQCQLRTGNLKKTEQTSDFIGCFTSKR